MYWLKLRPLRGEYQSQLHGITGTSVALRSASDVVILILLSYLAWPRWAGVGMYKLIRTSYELSLRTDGYRTDGGRNTVLLFFCWAGS